MAEREYRCGLADALGPLIGPALRASDLISRAAAVAALSALVEHRCPTGNPGAMERPALRRAIEAVAALPPAFAGEEGAGG